MIGRIVLTGTVLLAFGASPVLAGSPMGLWMLKQTCPHASQSQCAIQIVKGNGNIAVTEQTTNRKRARQFALTFQKGDNNQAYTGQSGKQQVSLTTQVGNGNAGFTHQSGAYQASVTKQSGDGHWAATSSIGDGTATWVIQTN